MTYSFVVIAYNEERNIAATLQSILAQDGLTSFEVVVVNDGSRDNTAEIVRDIAKRHPQVRLIDQKNAGRGAARAVGVQAAKGDYIAFIDADIILPLHWLSTCQKAMGQFDAVGGIAVPDGDVAFVHRIFKLTPKPAPPTTTITGNNGFFKRQIFDKVSYNPTKKDGEDVDLVHQINAAGFTTTLLTDLLVEHHESKSYLESFNWLFVSGRGATRQFYEHHQVRLPDLAFVGFMGLLVACIVAGFAWPSLTVFLGGIPVLYVLGTSSMHLLGKFRLAKSPLRSLAAIVVNATFMVAYYAGRAEGIISQSKYA